MGNYFVSESTRIENNQYLDDLKKWENKIKVNNLKRNSKTNNGPNYINDLKLWSNKIKMNNFVKNNNTNNPPDSIKKLRLRNQYLENKLDKLECNFNKISII